MPAGPQRRIDRLAVEHLSQLELRARLTMEGFYTGIHKSPYHGVNVEFAEYREYTPGDDLRRIDWRVLARSDRFFVKRFEAETNLRSYILLDTSGSMGFASGHTTRLDYAAGIAAALALLLLRQGDQVGLCTFDSTVRTFTPPRGSARHFTVLHEALVNVQPGQDTDLASVFRQVVERVRRRSLLIVISDLFDNVERLLHAFQHFRSRRHEVVVFHLLDDAELDFPFDRVTLFEGMERSEEVVVDPHVVRQSYNSRLNKYLENLRQGCAEKAIDYCRVRTSDPMERALIHYLARRVAGAGAIPGAGESR